MKISYSQKNALVKFGALSLGLLLCCSGYMVLLGLQSSINIAEGLGTTGLASTYIASVIFGITFTPVLLQKLKTRHVLFLCELSYFSYILANYYPVPYLFIPAAMLVGVGESTIYPAALLFCGHYARQYARDAKRDVQAYVTEFTGVLFASFMMSGIFGAGISQLIFFGGSRESPLPSNTSSSVSNTSAYDFSYCGINDCQNPNITYKHMDSYRPASPLLLNVLIGVMAGLVFLGFLVHAVFLRNISPEVDPQTRDLPSYDKDKVKVVAMENNSKEEKTAESPFTIVSKTLKATLLHITNPKQLLITPLTIYYGLLFGIYVTDYTRAYASCVIGVEKVTLVSLISAACGIVTSVISTKVASRVGRNIPFLIAAFNDLSVYTIGLTWTPTEESVWVVYVMFAMAGFGVGVWLPLTGEMCGAYFPDNQEIAYTVWTLFMGIGVAWQAGWSTSLCMRAKTYFQIGMLCMGLICYRVSVYLYPSKETKRGSEISAESTYL